MKLLLDTNAFIWWNAEPDKLPQRVFSLFQDMTNVLMLSVASVWEIQIKLQSGKLTMAAPLETIVQLNRERNDLQILPIMLEHVLQLGSLPAHHKDPFDRLLIAQAKAEKAALVTADTQLKPYPIKIIW